MNPKYKYNGVNAPKCPGWWWCFPVPECEWYEHHKNGVVCQIVADDGCMFRDNKYYPEYEGLSVESTFGMDYHGFSDLKYSGELVGKWYGPIESPLGDADES